MVKGKLNQWNMDEGHYAKMAKCLPLCKKDIIQQNFKLLIPKVWVSASPHVDSNGMWASAIIKNGNFFNEI